MGSTSGVGFVGLIVKMGVVALLSSYTPVVFVMPLLAAVAEAMVLESIISVSAAAT